MAYDITKVPFGVATITCEYSDGTKIEFDGKNYLQVEGGEVKLTPQFAEIQFADTGETIHDRRITGYEGTLTLSVGQDDIEVFRLALAASKPITDAKTNKVVGLTDLRVGASMKEKAVKVTIHPRQYDTKDYDIVIYQMASTGDFSKAYNMEQGSVAVELTMFPREGADFTQDSNFFYIGPIDPNAAVKPSPEQTA